MNVQRWLQQNTASLDGKTVAITGATGGIGTELCRYLVKLGASLILLDRNADRSAALAKRLQTEVPTATVDRIQTDLSSMVSVRRTAAQLRRRSVDVFIHNAGAYSIPRVTCDSGYDAVFQINFAAPYYLIRTLLPTMKAGARVVVVGSIAHNYSHIDRTDLDFSTRRAASKAYGNAKRYLMFSLYELFREEAGVSLSVTHPGIAFTNITAHYPPWLFAIIKYPMKVLFMKPRVAALSVLRGVFEATGYHEWIGPWLFDVWGRPKKRRLHTCTAAESQTIGTLAERVFENVCREGPV